VTAGGLSVTGYSYRVPPPAPEDRVKMKSSLMVPGTNPPHVLAYRYYPKLTVRRRRQDYCMQASRTRIRLAASHDSLDGASFFLDAFSPGRSGRCRPLVRSTTRLEARRQGKMALHRWAARYIFRRAEVVPAKHPRTIKLFGRSAVLGAAVLFGGGYVAFSEQVRI
jgi:hypothetical protein